MRKISLWLLFLAGFVIVLAACSPSIQPVTAAQPDELPLTGANRSRLGAAALTIQSDPSTGAFAIVPVAADTGQPVEGAEPVRMGGYEYAASAFSSDRDQMVFLSNRTEGCSTYCLYQIDLRNWKETVKPLDIQISSAVWFPVAVFDKEDRALPVVINQQTQSSSAVLLIDLAQASLVQETSLPANVIRAAYTPEGALAVYAIQTSASGQESFVYLALLDGVDLHILWETTLPEVKFIAEWPGDHSDPTKGKYLNPAAAFSPDGSRLYLAAADKPLLVTIDFSKRAVSTARIQPRLSLLERLIANTAGVAYAKTMNGINKSGVLSPDGRYYYVIGQETKAVKNERGEYEMEVIPLGLQVIDTQDGALLRSISTETNQLAISSDGSTLLLQGWRAQSSDRSAAWTDVLDTTTWEVIQTLEGTANPSRLLDGSLAWLLTRYSNDGNTSNIDLYRPGHATPSSQITGPSYMDWILIP